MKPSVSNERHCQEINKHGIPCKARPLHLSSYCFFHDPKKSSDRTRAQSKGGAMRPSSIVPTGIKPSQFSSAQEIESLLCETINDVRGGNIDFRIANTIGYLCVILMRAREQNALESRLHNLEQYLGNTEQ